MDRRRAVPAFSSRTKAAGSLDVTDFSESGSVLSTILVMLPSRRAKIMSSGMYVFFIHIAGITADNVEHIAQSVAAVL